METKTFYEKLLSAQMEIGAIKKEQSNPFFHSFYADINAILAVVKPILNKHGLILTQALTTKDTVVGIETEIADITAKGIISFCPLPTMPDPQKFGSAVTYYRRYSLQSLLALEATDDDGNVASDKSPTYPSYKIPEKPSHDKDFMADLQPTDEEVITWSEKLESAKTTAELKEFWKLVPPMVKDKLEKLKNELKFKLT